MRPPDGRDGVLVLDGNSQCGLSVIRSLGEKGVPVTAGSHNSHSLGMVSRHSDDAYVHPDPSEGRELFLRHLLSHLERADYFAVFPVQDHTSLLLAKNKPMLERTGTVVATEDWATFDRAFDKGKLFEAIAPLDIPSPETHAPTSMAEVADLADDIDYPVVIKPRSKSHLTESGYAVSLVTDENYVDSAEGLRRTYRSIEGRFDGPETGYPLIQEYVPGTTTTTVALAGAGELLAYFQERRLRTYPSSGGNSALLAAVSDSTMLEYSEEVLDSLGWSGPVMVEFMRTPEGEYYLIEVNGRYWGSVPFAIECGVDVPWLHYLQLRGLDPSATVEFGEYRTDVVQRRLFYEDVKWLGEHLRRGDVGAVVPFLVAFVRTRHTFFDVNDPRPTVEALVQAAGLGFRSVSKRALDGRDGLTGHHVLPHR